MEKERRKKGEKREQKCKERIVSWHSLSIAQWLIYTSKRLFLFILRIDTQWNLQYDHHDMQILVKGEWKSASFVKIVIHCAFNWLANVTTVVLHYLQFFFFFWWIWYLWYLTRCRFIIYFFYDNLLHMTFMRKIFFFAAGHACLFDDWSSSHYYIIVYHQLAGPIDVENFHRFVITCSGPCLILPNPVAFCDFPRKFTIILTLLISL